ncbi:hypothetical protein BD769DRAFT_1680124 [Suillus cothurnatus]|nr:hypothetical protein BD769DRAFT_1680124 [Suillus cothurnatus]
MDTAKSLTHSCIEVTHPTGTDMLFWGNYKNIPLKKLYSPSLLSSLHRDLRIKVGEALDIDMELDDEPTVQENADEVPRTQKALWITETMQELILMYPITVATSILMETRMRIGTMGRIKASKYTSTKFWNFVDDSLEAVRNMAKAEAKADVEEGGIMTPHTRMPLGSNILVEYFQQDLAEFPGRRTVPKLLSTYNPQWQMTIQTELLWTT